MTLYEINQQAYAQLPTLSKETLEKKTKELTKFLQATDSNYYMMLDPEGKYYTIYTYKSDSRLYYRMAQEIIDVTKTLGDIKSIEVDDDKVEFWVVYKDECKMFALFDYQNGVITVG